MNRPDIDYINKIKNIIESLFDRSVTKTLTKEEAIEELNIMVESIVKYALELENKLRMIHNCATQDFSDKTVALVYIGEIRKLSQVEQEGNR
jgi:hypothetical protein